MNNMSQRCQDLHSKFYYLSDFRSIPNVLPGYREGPIPKVDYFNNVLRG